MGFLPTLETMPELSPIIRPGEIAKIHLKSQALVNLFFALPMILLVMPFWGLPLIGVVKVMALYISAYVLVFVPVWILLPRLLLRPAQSLLQRIATGQDIDDNQARWLVKFLLNYPLTSAFWQSGIIMVGFVLGGLLILPTGIIPEIMPILRLAIAYLIVIGMVVSAIEPFLNFTLLENRLSSAISRVLIIKPQLAADNFQARSVSLLVKMLFIVLGTVMAAQLILFTLTVGKMIISFPEAVLPTAAYLGTFMVLTAGYIVVAATMFTRNISNPLQQLIGWSGRVTKGERGSLPLATNDEIDNVVRNSNTMVQSMSDLTTWLESERDQVGREKDKLSVILSRVADGVVATNPKGEIVLFNQAMEKLTGLKEEEVIGRPLSESLHLFRENDRPYPIADALEIRPTVAGSHQHTRHANLRLDTKRHQDKFVTLSATTMDESGGTDELGWILTFHDITEERELERMKLDFVSMAAHELRTPLTSIRGYLSLLSTEMGDKLTKEELLFLNRSLIGSNQLAALIENLLNVSKIERGALKVELSPISMSRMIADLITNITEVANQKQIKLVYQPPVPDDRLVMADQIRIAEVVNNLLANAINYSPTNTTVTVAARPQANHLVVTVSDQGEGIPAQALPHLFTKFYRVSGDLSQGSKGTGLGLYISKAIVEAHHGSISAESQVNHGSTFTFTVPFAPEGAKEMVFHGPEMLRPSQTPKRTSTNQLK